MRAITDNILWSRVAFWCAFIGVSLAVATFIPTLVDWLALEGGKRLKRAQAPSLILQAGGILGFIASIVLRMHAGLAHLAPLAFVFADAGVTAFAAAALISGDGYRPLGVAFNPRPRHLSSGLK